jgi:hypothetical protein
MKVDGITEDHRIFVTDAPVSTIADDGLGCGLAPAAFVRPIWTGAALRLQFGLRLLRTRAAPKTGMVVGAVSW